MDTIWLDEESQATTARRMMQQFACKMVCCKLPGKLLQADGAYLFECFAVIRQSGRWKAPVVTVLRVVLGSGGQGGGREARWFVGGSGNIPGDGTTSGYGKGLDSPGQQVTVQGHQHQPGAGV